MKPSLPQAVMTCIHCEAVLIAVMTYLAGDSKHELGPLFEVCFLLPSIMVISWVA
jgi:hypothetical protein